MTKVRSGTSFTWLLILVMITIVLTSSYFIVNHHAEKVHGLGAVQSARSEMSDCRKPTNNKGLIVMGSADPKKIDFKFLVCFVDVNHVLIQIVSGEEEREITTVPRVSRPWNYLKNIISKENLYLKTVKGQIPDWFYDILNELFK